MKINKPLDQNEASPCMKCGSVECAFCSEDVRSALELLKKKVADILEEGYFGNPLIQDDANWVLEQIDFCFPCFQERG